MCHIYVSFNYYESKEQKVVQNTSSIKWCIPVAQAQCPNFSKKNFTYILLNLSLFLVCFYLEFVL